VWKDQTFESLAQFQLALDQSRGLYNNQYPSQSAHCQGSPALSVFPSATHTGRPYHYDLERELFDLKRVDAFLAGRVWARKVASNGAVHIGGFYYLMGTSWAGQSVSVRFLPDSRSFRFESEQGQILIILPALGIEQDQLIGTFPAHLPLPVGFQFVLPLPGV
jgi:hypothetical protein